MGRKPIKANLLMKQFTHWLDPEVMERVHQAVGKQKVSEFVRGAIERELERLPKQSTEPTPSTELTRRERRPSPKGSGTE